MRAPRESGADALHHMCRVVQGSVGQAEWEIIDDGMAMGTISLADVLTLVGQLTDATVKARTADPGMDEEAVMLAKLAELRAAKEAGAGG